MKRTKINWRSDDVTFWDLDFLDADIPLPEQLDDLKEDLAQAHYGGFVLDIGWFPSSSEQGTFVVRVVHESDWEAPCFSRSPQRYPICSNQLIGQFRLRRPPEQFDFDVISNPHSTA